jgi:hypothetical protein
MSPLHKISGLDFTLKIVFCKLIVALFDDVRWKSFELSGFVHKQNMRPLNEANSY